MSGFNASLHPFTRMTIFIVIITGLFITKDLIILIYAYVFVLFMIICTGQLKMHLRFLIIAALPFLLLLFAVYLFILKDSHYGNLNDRLLLALSIFLRITVITSLFQFTFNLPADKLLYFLRKIGLKGSSLIIVLSSFVVWKDFVNRSNKIVVARYARGYIKKRSLFYGLRQIPYVIKPLFITTLLMTIDRTSSWKQRNFLVEIDELKLIEEKLNPLEIILNISLILCTLLWLVLLITNK